MSHADTSSSAPEPVPPPETREGPPPETSEPSTCPICEFLDAGPCGNEHKVWVACRGEAKEQGVDYVEHCGDMFKAFFGCMLSHQDYHRPFLEAFHVDTERSQEAIDSANIRKQQEQQHQHQHQQQDRPDQPVHGNSQPEPYALPVEQRGNMKQRQQPGQSTAGAGSQPLPPHHSEEPRPSPAVEGSSGQPAAL